MTSETQTPDLLAGLRSGDWLDAQTFPPLAWTVPGLVPEGMSLLVGPPKVGKSWMTLDLALAVASGGRALGRVPVGTPRPVLLLALEDGDRRMQTRCRELLNGAPIPAGLHYLTRVEAGQIHATIRAWLDQLSNFADPLVVLDTLGKTMPRSLPGETDYQRDYRVAGELKRLTDERPGMSLLVVHHDRKAATDDFVQSVSGTNGIAGAADSIVILSRPRVESSALLKVTGRDVEEAEYAVSVTGGHWTLDGETLVEAAQLARQTKATSGLSDRSAEVLRTVEHSPNGIRANEIATKLGISTDDAGRYLRRLRDAGKVASPSRGVFVPPVRSVRVSETPTGVGDPLFGQPDTTDTPCKVCRFPLTAGLVAAGETTHPTCSPEGEPS
ncbi:hypothetical protein CGZ94_20665 [Enemella evansiae]|uniref:AAA family ATPase n=1 Tax=Enemella evansiae TaxID=2016499 RepID=A0A255G4W4_9ACTN|nr:AAA family ATPase [Enemella evansiae]OYO07884.1 hypothetical protein CGZ94_20665 [Enemella evansiae]